AAQHLGEQQVALEYYAHLAEDLKLVALDDGGEQVFLVPEVDIERALRHARLARDVVHARRIEALAHEDTLRAVQYLLALHGILAGGGPPVRLARHLRSGSTGFAHVF